MSSSIDLDFLENFIETLAIILSRGLSNSETEAFATSWTAFQQKLRQLSGISLG